MSGVGVTYAPGDVLLVTCTASGGDVRLALVDHDTDPGLVTDLWAVLGTLDGDSHDDVLDVLTSRFGVSRLPDFAVVSGSATAWLVSARGRLALLDDAGAPVGEGSRGPWETTRTTATSLSWGEVGFDAGLPLRSGAARVSGVQVAAGDAPDTTAAAPRERPAPAPVAPPVAPSVASPAVPATPPVAVPAPTAPPVAPPAAGSSPGSYSAWLGRARRTPEQDDRPDTAPDDIAAAVPDDAPDHTPDVDEAEPDLSGRGDLTRVWTGAEHPVEDDPEAIEPPPAPAARPVVPPTSPGLIDGVPWATTSTPAKPPAPAAGPPPATTTTLPAQGAPRPAQTPEPLGPRPDDAAQTVMRTSLTSVSDPSAGHLVPAVTCPQGHVTAPGPAACRTCGSPVPAGPTHEVPRPPLGMLRLSTGDSVLVDRGVVLGRDPSVPDDAVARPHLVKLGPEAEGVSRQHLEIELEGWEIRVRDLGSSNGTTLVSGTARTALEPGVFVALATGDRVEILDEFSFELVAAP